MSAEHVVSYLAATIVIVAIPGPNVILVINDSVKYGFGKSVITILGIKAGILLLFFLSLTGLAALLSMYSPMFAVVKWLGVCYLAYLGFSQMWSSFQNRKPSDPASAPGRSFFVRGFLVSATNPKGMLFAGAFFPQFLDRELALIPQIMWLCGTFLIISFIIEALYALAGDTASRALKAESFKKYTERVSGALLLAFGVGLAFARSNR